MPARAILQKELPLKPWMTPSGSRLPGLSPVPAHDWLLQDDAFAAQMAYRDDLIKNNLPGVYACLPRAEASARELLDLLTAELPENDTGYTKRASMLIRPDGLSIETDTDTPLLTAGQLVQEDFALIQKDGDRHRLTGGIICFPAHWRLADKIGKTLTGLHSPVPAFTPDIAARTARIFDHLRSGQPLMRANFLIYTNPDLHQPFPEQTTKTLEPDHPRYVRVERQTLRRLPLTGTIVFAIHTFIVPASHLTPEECAALAKLRPDVLGVL